MLHAACCSAAGTGGKCLWLTARCTPAACPGPGACSCHCVQLQFVVLVSGQLSLHSGHRGQQQDVCNVPILDSRCSRQMVLSESNPCVQSVQWSVVTTDDVITVTMWSQCLMHAQCQWPGDRRLQLHTLQHCGQVSLQSAVTLTSALQFCTLCSPGSAISQSHLPQCNERQII